MLAGFLFLFLWECHSVPVRLVAFALFDTKPALVFQFRGPSPQSYFIRKAPAKSLGELLSWNHCDSWSCNLVAREFVSFLGWFRFARENVNQKYFVGSVDVWTLKDSKYSIIGDHNASIVVGPLDESNP